MGRVINKFVAESWTGMSNVAFEDAEEGSEAIAAADQSEQVVANDATMDQVYAMQDNAESMDNAADFIETNVNQNPEGASVGEVGLAEQVADLATQGTGDSSEQVMPAAESYVKSKIALEGFRETVRNIMAAIKRMLRTVFERLKKFWKKMFGRCKPIIADAQKLAARAKSTGGKHLNEKTLEVSSYLAGACVIGKKVERNISTVITTFERNAELLTKDMYQGALKDNLDIGEALIDALNDIDGTDASVTKGLETLVSKVDAKYKAYRHNFATTKSSDKRFESSAHDVYESAEILGGKKFFVQEASGSSTVNPIERARAVADCRIYFSDAVKDQPTVESATVEIPQLSTIEKLAGLIEDTAKEVHRFESGKGFRDQERIRDRVEKAADKLSGRKVADDDRAAGLSNKLRTAAAFSTLFVEISQKPYTPMANHMCTIMRQLLSLGNSCVSAYTSERA